MKILIFGLPGSGKTWLAERLVQNIDNCAWYNADIVRTASNDWDFSKEGRSRQAMRMKTFANFEKNNGRYVICDFVAPSKAARESFGADWTPKVFSILALLLYGSYVMVVTLFEHSQQSETVISLVLGQLSGILGTAAAFFYGSSSKK